MRRILVEHARRRLRAKRGGGIEPLDVNEVEIASPIADDDVLLRLSDALESMRRWIRARPSWSNCVTSWE